ncbi:MAG: hypothetical protein HS113_01905 [Verrucomicrobiales bacterium]|nr:hypothetical protein [Verrucomicrobiales bacterium]
MFEQLHVRGQMPAETATPREWFCSAALCAYLQLPRDLAAALPWQPAGSLKQFEAACERLGVPAPPSTSNTDPGFLRWLEAHADSQAATWVRHMQRIRSANRTAKVFAYSGQPVVRLNFGRQPVDWPEPSPALIAEVLAEVPPAFEVHRDTGLSASEVLPGLFRPGELVCTGRNTEQAMVRPLEETLADADRLQFIVVNPMRDRAALNYRGRPSPRCQNNTGLRRHLVAELDDLTLTKVHQALLISRLATFAPLALVVDSGGKSLHAWFRVSDLTVRDQVRFFCVACLLGADPTRWDICGWLRMPGGLRVVEGVPTVRQRIIHLSPEACLVGFVSPQRPADRPPAR